jgi:hypothetical protein
MLILTQKADILIPLSLNPLVAKKTFWYVHWNEHLFLEYSVS